MKSRSLLLAVALLLCSALPALANPTQFGDTGLLSQPTAETLNAGNICLGLWGNSASGEESDATVIPFAITLGLGTFIEMYGSYPNLLFNGDEDASGRGFANLGMKLRVFGQRSSPFKLAIDGQARRSISDRAELDGLTDYVGRLIASYNGGRFGLHANAGYVATDSPAVVELEDQLIYGAGIEFFPAARLRLIAELEAASERINGGDQPREAMLGFQYFVSPHFTINLGVGIGLSDASPDWRALVGLTTCQGVGSYAKPIPRIIEPEAEEMPAEPEPVQPVKIRTLTPLIPKAAPVETSPGSRLEVPVASPVEEILLTPSERLVLPAGTELSALPVAPIASAAVIAAPAATLLAGEPILAVLHRKFRLPEFSFEYDQWSLSPQGKKAIGEVAAQLRKENRWFIIKVDGHSDSVGSEKYNHELSLRRAISTATHMVVHAGFDPARVFVKGYGESQPIAPNLTTEGRQENRRVEILILLPKEGLR